jgi:hypothetical protein
MRSVFDSHRTEDQSYESSNFRAGHSAEATNGKSTKSVTILSDAIARAGEIRSLLDQAKALLPEHSQRLAAYARACDSLADSLRRLITKSAH